MAERRGLASDKVTRWLANKHCSERGEVLGSYTSQERRGFWPRLWHDGIEELLSTADITGEVTAVRW
jgi:hypothetical protein